MRMEKRQPRLWPIKVAPVKSRSFSSGTCVAHARKRWRLQPMSGSPSDRNSLEERWRRRVEDVGLRLDFARTFVEEVQKDLAAGAVPAADGTFSYRRALRAENIAAVEFGRVLLIYA